MQLNPLVVQQQINNLRVAFPELAEDEENWLLSLESETGLDEILTSIVRQIEDAKALSDGTLERLEELKARKDRFARRVDSLRSLAFKLMEAANIAKRELPEATLSLRAGQPKLVGDADPATLPDELVRVTREANKAAIKDHIKAGGSVPGYELSNSEPSLTIRIK